MSERWTRPGTVLLAIVIASAALKLAILAWIGDDIPAVLDEKSYLHAARAIAAGRGIEYPDKLWDDITQPPLYPYFLGTVLRLGGDVGTAKLIQVVLATVTVVFVYLLGARAIGERAGLIAAAVFAFYPTAVAFTHYLWNETLFIFFWTGAACLLIGRDGRCAGPLALAAAGAAFGAAALTRSFAVNLIPFVVIWIAWQTRSPRATVVRALALVVGLMIVLAPHLLSVRARYGSAIINNTALAWYRNYNIHDPFNADWGFLGKRPPPHLTHDIAVDGEQPRPREMRDNPVEWSHAERQRALMFARERPGLVARQTAMRVVEFLNPTSFLIRHLRLGLYRYDAEGRQSRAAPPSWLVESLIALTVAAYLSLATFAVLGLASMDRSATRSLLLTMILLTIAIHGLGAGMSRYRLVLAPLLAVAAGAFLADPRRALRTLRGPRHAVPAFAVLVALVGAWSVHIAKIWSPGP